MPAPTATADPRAGRVRYPRARARVAWFTVRRTVRTAGVWGLAAGLLVYTTVAGFTTIAPTAAERAQVLTDLAANRGLRALLGEPYRVETVAGLVDWRVLGTASLVVAIWGLLTATRVLRGEEAAGRWEVFLTGRTTARRATASALAGVAGSVLVLAAVVAAITWLVGMRDDAGFSGGRSLLFAAAVAAPAAVFLALGALTSQLVATRAQAAGLAGAGFAVAFMLRALGNAAPDVHWLVYLSPLGWVEQLRPLTDPRPVWLLPSLGLVALLAGLTVWLADRDLGSSVWADPDTARPRTALLTTPGRLALRLSWVSIVAWLAAMAIGGLLYGSLARSAGEAFASSTALEQFDGAVADTAVTEGARAYAGVVFLMAMTVLMVYVASAVSRLRQEEGSGLLDNLLVRTVSRLRWLAGRVVIIVGVVVGAGLLAALGFWLGAARQQTGLTAGDLLTAGVNSLAPALLLLGIGLATFGLLPRVTAVVSYGLVAWSFVVEILGSVIDIPQLILDTSLLHHPAPAPAADPNWRVVGTYLALGLVLGVAGAVRLHTRDLASD